MSAKLMPMIAMLAAVLAFAGLAVAFVLKSPAYVQVLAGLAAVAALDWSRRESQKTAPSVDRSDPD